MISLPLQSITDETVVVVLLFISFFVAVVLSLVVGVKGLQSYRVSHDRGIVFLTVGILLLSGVAGSINVAFTLFTAVPGWIVTTGANLVRLLGVIIIIVTIYDS